MAPFYKFYVFHIFVNIMLHGISLAKIFVEQYKPFVKLINNESSYNLTILYTFFLLLKSYLFTSCCCISAIHFLSIFLNYDIIYYVKKRVIYIIVGNIIISLIPCCKANTK
ncbi:Hypothetical protein SRAE_1000183700 [Strongyloides ratti]|uniref:Uncharacterized protein n=1 Tax=Strongyloides ratti TaxID=34506 RepID=A0A090L1K4_STRRB|nr:Hypothetical protein SRAE_1000183700 [Strongyloides ratti]CEF63577.1 Hypothetical protein SRAE_1000183700 [Strongyloides ratti]